MFFMPCLVLVKPLYLYLTVRWITCLVELGSNLVKNRADTNGALI
jgi:hypothetical protein